MHRRTIKSFAALASVAVAIGGTGGAASAAISHHAVRTGGKPVTATTLSAGRSAARIKGSAPGGGQELNNLCRTSRRPREGPRSRRGPSSCRAARAGVSHGQAAVPHPAQAGHRADRQRCFASSAALRGAPERRGPPRVAGATGATGAGVPTGPAGATGAQGPPGPGAVKLNYEHGTDPDAARCRDGYAGGLTSPAFPIPIASRASLLSKYARHSMMRPSRKVNR